MGDPPRRGRGSALCRLGVRALVAAIAVVAMGACQLDLSVELEAAARGAGSVRATVLLDPEAAVQVRDLARQLRVEDLERAGWKVDGPRPAGGGAGGVAGGVALHVSKRFTSPGGAVRAVEELSGAGGPFSTLRLTRKRSLWKTRTALTGTVDLKAGLDAFGDPALAEKLGGPGLGLDPAALEREIGKSLTEAVTVEVVGRLPGRVSSNAPAARGGALVWPVRLGAATSVSASSEAWNVASLAFGGVALLSGVSLLLLVLFRLGRRT